jgi:acyl-CoA thioester hydrolase
MSLNDLMDAGILFPIASVEVKYKNSCKYDDEYEVQTSLTALSKIKMDFDQKVIRLRDGAVAAEGKLRCVFTDANGKPTRLSSEWLERLQATAELDNTKE